MSHLVRPTPLSTDGSNEFARFSMAVRVPKILDDVLQRNPDYSPGIKSAIEELRDGIAGDAPLPELAFPAPDATEWEPEWLDRRGETWLKSQWFFGECYVYRCLMIATRYFETGRDPFTPAKQAELDGRELFERLGAVLETAGGKPGDRLFALLGAALWGNRVDLSYAVGKAFGHDGAHDDLLCDDRVWVVERLLAAKGDVHLVADNAGSELAMDLALAAAVLELSPARVTFHVKSHPTFVSDALAADVWALIFALQRRDKTEKAVAEQLAMAFSSGRFRIAPDGFWNGPRFLWQRPSRLSRELDRADLVVLKGDANYRRALGDAIWPSGTTFAEATAYLPAPLVCLRTMKSDSLAGIPAERIAALDAADSAWRVNGRRGVIQAKR
jgi:hypothetical protein